MSLKNDQKKITNISFKLMKIHFFKYFTLFYYKILYTFIKALNYSKYDIKMTKISIK